MAKLFNQISFGIGITVLLIIIGFAVFYGLYRDLLIGAVISICLIFIVQNPVSKLQLFEATSKIYPIVESSKRYGLDMVLAPFKDHSQNRETGKQRGTETKDEILNAFKRTNSEILLSGITLYEFFDHEESIYKYINGIRPDNSSITFRILILSQKGEAIKLKAMMEGDYKNYDDPKKAMTAREFTVFKMIKTSIETFDNLNSSYNLSIIEKSKNHYLSKKKGRIIAGKKCPQCNSDMLLVNGEEICSLENSYIEENFSLPFIQYKFIDFIPPCRLVITKEMLFIEQYFLAELEKIDNTIITTDPISHCVTGRIPILRYENISPVYKMMKEQFNLLWGVDEQIITYPGIVRNLEDKYNFKS